MNTIKTKFFEELTTKELYEILKARAEIFVVEQECVYQDLDDIDYRSLHVFYEEDGKVTAYLRAFEKDTDVVQMGRVLTIEHGKGLGNKILRDGIVAVREKYNPDTIFIEAQCYATGFYEKMGFDICSEEFLEDGIPHVAMELDLRVKPFHDTLDEYLRETEVVNYLEPGIQELVEELSLGVKSSMEYVIRTYEYVRDRISHSADISHDQVTCHALEVLEEGHGICFAKANLLCALLRAKGIPAGYCYQKLVLDDESAPELIFHGLNGVYIEEIGRWIRLDARGNRSDVQAEFSVGAEKLAFPIREELGEQDYKMVFAKPDENILKALRENKTRTDLWANLPRELAYFKEDK